MSINPYISKLRKNRENKSKNLLTPTLDSYSTFNTDDKTKKAANKIAAFVNENQSYSLPELSEDFLNTGIVFNIHDDPEEIDAQLKEHFKDEQKLKAEQQSAWEAWGNFAVQVLGSEIVLGTLKGVVDIGDAAYNIITGNGLGDFSNPISGTLEKGQNYIRNKFSIIEEDPNSTFNFNDLGWWLNRGTSVASSITLLLPGLGAGKLASMGGKSIRGLYYATKSSNSGRKIIEATKNIGKIGSKSKLTTTAAGAINGLSQTSKASSIVKAQRTFGQNYIKGYNMKTRVTRALEQGEKIVGGALASRTAEGYMESREVWNDVYNIALQELQLPKNKEYKDKLIAEHPELEGLKDEEIAEILADQSAKRTFNQDLVLLAFDLLQFKAINNILNGGVKGINKISTVKTRLANKNIAKKIAGKSSSELKNMNFFQRRLDALTHPSFNALSILLEGPEEIYQGIAIEQGKEEFYKTLYPDFEKRSLSSYMKDPHIWEQGFWGVIGGGVFNAGAKVLNTLVTKHNSKKNPDEINKIYNDYLLTSEEKIALSKINARQEHFNKLLNNIANAETDLQNKIIDDTEFNIRREGYINDFITDVTLDALDSGTYNLLKDFMSDPEFKQALKDNNIELQSTDGLIEKTILTEMDKVRDIYADEVYTVLKNIDEINPYVAQLVGRETARKKIYLNRLKDRISNNDAIIAQSLIDNPNSEIIQKINNSYYNKKLKEELLKEKKNIEKQIENYKKQPISEQAKEAYIKDLQKTLDIINDELNTYVGNEYISTSQPNNEIKEKLDENVKNKIEYIKTKSQINITKEDYINTYEYFTDALDKETKRRFDEAYESVINWFEKQDNLDTAYNLILNNEISELNESLDILKLGYGNSEMYHIKLKLMKAALEQERKGKNNGNITNEDVINPEVQEAVDNNKRKAEEDAKLKSKFNTINAKLTSLNKLLKQPNKATNEEIKNRINEIETYLKSISDDIVRGLRLSNEQLNEFIKLDEKLTKLKNDLNIETETEITEETETEKIENEDIIKPPFKGEEIEYSVDESGIDNSIYTNDIETEIINEDIKKNLQTDTDRINEEDLIGGSAYSVIADLFKKDKKLFSDVTSSDPNSEEFKKLLEVIKEEMQERAIYGRNIDEIILNDLKKVITSLKRIIKNKKEHLNLKDQLDNIAEALSIGIKFKIGDEYLTNADFIDDTNVEETLNEFFNTYIEFFNIKDEINNKKVINLNLLFEYLFNNDNFSFTDVYNIFNLLKNNINKINNYSFINIEIFEKYKDNPNAFNNSLQLAKQKRQIEERYTHAEGSRYSDKKDIDKVLSEIKNGDELTYETSNESNVISLKYKGVEIAYLKKVKHDGTKTTFSLVSDNLGSFNIEVKRDANGEYKSNLDNLFLKIINNSKEVAGSYHNLLGNEIKVTYSKILEALTISKEYPIKIKILKQQNANEEITDEEYTKKVNELNNQLLDSKLILDNLYDILTSNNVLTESLFKPLKDVTGINKQKTNNALVNALNNIINYNTTDRYNSYIEFLKKQYNNYVQTYNIQEAIDNGNKTIVFGGTSNAELKYGHDQIPINDSKYDFNHENNHLLILDGGSFVDEVTGQIYGNQARYGESTFALLLNQNPTAPLVALLQPAKLNSSEIMQNAVRDELKSIFADFQNEKLDFDEVYVKLVHLLGSQKESRKNSLFSGLNVFRNEKIISIWKKTEDSIETIAMIHKYQKDNETLSTAISHIKKGKAHSTFRTNNKFINKLIEDITSKLYFNKTYYAINNRNNDTSSNRSPYFYRENNKIKINIGGFNKVYDSYTQFILDVGAFTTNHESITYDTSKGIYIEISEISNPSPVKGEVSIPTKDNQELNTRNIFAEVEDDFTVFDELSGKTELTQGIDLIPETIIYENTDKKAYAYFDPKTKKIVLTKKGIDNINEHDNKSMCIIRLLMHEQVHKKIDYHNLFEQKELVNELIETYNKFLEYIKNDNSAEAKHIKNWLTASNFNSIENYISDLNNKKVSKLEEEDYRRFAEEWLIESITQPFLMNYLNNVSYNDVNVSDLKEENKTIWQKIIDTLLKIFGKTIKNIKNNTILAKHYMLLGKKYGNNFNEQNIERNNEDINNNIENNDFELKETEDDDINFFDEVKRKNKKKDMPESFFATTEFIDENNKSDIIFDIKNQQVPTISSNFENIKNKVSTWVNDISTNNPKLLQEVIEALKVLPEFGDTNFENINNRVIELLTNLADREYYNKIENKIKNEINSENNINRKTIKQNAWNRIKVAISDFWNWIQRNIFHTRPKNWQDFVDEIIYGDSKTIRFKNKFNNLTNNIFNIQKELLNGIFRKTGIDIQLENTETNIEQVAIANNIEDNVSKDKIETVNEIIDTNEKNIEKEQSEQSKESKESKQKVQVRQEQRQRQRNADREKFKKAFKKGGEKAYDLLYELHGGIVSTYPNEFLNYLKNTIGIPEDVASVVEKAHDYLIYDFTRKNKELFGETNEDVRVEEVHSLLATKGYSLLEHTIDNGKALGVKMMYRDKFIPSGKTDTSYTPEGYHGRSVICYYNHPEVRLANQYVFTVTKNNATETPTAYELAANPSLITPEWETYLESVGRKNEDGTFNFDKLEPNFNDPFSLSHLMIRIGKKGVHDVEIISRYNHGTFDSTGEYQIISGQPNATLGNDLNKLVDGLFQSLMEYKNIDPAEAAVATGEDIKIANDDKIYIYNQEIGGRYFGNDFWIDIDNTAHVIDKNKERLFGTTLVTKDKIENLVPYTSLPTIPIFKTIFSKDGVEFYESAEEITEEHEVVIKGEKKIITKKTLKGFSKISFKNGILEVDNSDNFVLEDYVKMFNPFELIANNVSRVHKYFLSGNSTLEKITMNGISEIEDDFLQYSQKIKVLNFSNVESVGDYFVSNASSDVVINMPKLRRVGHAFMRMYNSREGSNPVDLYLPNLETTGNYFMQLANLGKVNLPNLEVVGHGFLMQAGTKAEINLPKLTKYGSDFLGGGWGVKSLNAPMLTNIDGDFMYANMDIRRQIESQIKTDNNDNIDIQSTTDNNVYYANTEFIDDNYSITNMNSYIRQFPISERAAITREINNGRLSFVCK